MKKEQLISELIRGTGLPKSAFDGYAQIELISNTQARLDGCKGIIEYSESKISLNLGNVCAEFCGAELNMNAFEDEQVVLSGIFSSISFT